MHHVILGDSEPGSSALAGRYRGVATVDHRVERGGLTGTTTPPARPARLHPTRVIRDRPLRLNPGVPAGDASTMEPASNPRRFSRFETLGEALPTARPCHGIARRQMPHRHLSCRESTQ